MVAGRFAIGTNFLKIGTDYLRVGTVFNPTTGLATFGDAAAIQQDAFNESIRVNGHTATDFYDNTGTFAGTTDPSFWVLCVYKGVNLSAPAFVNGSGTITALGSTVGDLELYKVVVSAFSSGFFGIELDWTATGAEVAPYTVSAAVLIPCFGSDVSFLGAAPTALSSANSAELAFGDYTGAFPRLNSPWQGDTGAGTNDGAGTAYNLDSAWLNPPSTSTEQTTDAWVSITEDVYVEILPP